jgi:hypothetical protein
MKKLIETINTDETENVLNKLRLSDVKIGQRFRFTKDGLIYIKDTEQGLHKQLSYCHTEKKIKTRGYGYEKERHTLREQKSFIYEILPDIIKQGGKREGSGAKPKYLEPTKTVAFRCPISRIPELKIIVKANLSDWAASPAKN